MFNISYIYSRGSLVSSEIQQSILLNHRATTLQTLEDRTNVPVMMGCTVYTMVTLV